MSWLDAVGGFAKGIAEGAWDGVKGTVSGVGRLAEDGYNLATDSHYREQVWNSTVNDAKAAANFAVTAVTDPGEAADEIGNTASHTWHALETAYNQAAARGQSSEFIGQIFGQGAALVGTALVPGGAEADAAEAIGDGSRAAALLGDAGKLTDASDTAGQVGAAAEKAAPDTLTLYRGDAPGTTIIKSHAAREYGYAGSQSIIDKGNLDELLQSHALDSSSPPSPFISLTTDPAVAKYFAGPDGAVNEFRISVTRAIRNPYNNLYVPAGPNGALVPESEFLVPNYIRPSEFVSPR